MVGERIAVVVFVVVLVVAVVRHCCCFDVVRRSYVITLPMCLTGLPHMTMQYMLSVGPILCCRQSPN